ncbi:hypothetical protein HMPREF2660_02755 [Weeksella sp. HMSC059D05]|nr:hypothetical protein HMPREF2660_02755 [Weeksella sp. HMSC059D05]
MFGFQEKYRLNLIIYSNLINMKIFSRFIFSIINSLSTKDFNKGEYAPTINNPTNGKCLFF